MRIYYQKPPYTALGYRNSAGELENQDNDLRFIRNFELIAGLEWMLPDKNRRFTQDAFYKEYDQFAGSLEMGIWI